MANSVTARFNDNCKVHVAMSDDTTVTKAVIIDADGNETDIGGGGGESDFSTAEVTILLGDSSPDADAIGIIHIDNDVLIADAILLDALTETRIYTLVLYKGHQFLNANSYTVKSVDGNATFNAEDHEIDITGDCILTLNYFEVQ